MNATYQEFAPNGKVTCGECPIRHQAVCSRCETDELLVLNRMKDYKTYKAGETIVLAGGPMAFVASVVTGVATLSQTLEDGRRQLVGLLLPSDFIGRPGRAIAPFDVVAVNEVTLCRFRRKSFEDLLEQSPVIGNRLLEMSMDELDAARQWLLILGRKTAREKIASMIDIVAQREAKLNLTTVGDGANCRLPMTREAMADYLGLSLATVSRQISALKRDKVIILNGMRDVTIPNYVALLEETGDTAYGNI